VLVIDDERRIIDAIGIGLRLQGFSVDGATTGPAGLELAQRAPPDVIVLDMMLPGLDGLAVCRQLRATPATSDVPIIMLTARDEIDDRIPELLVRRSGQRGGPRHRGGPLRAQRHLRDGPLALTARPAVSASRKPVAYRSA
jgi:CheY-like chemotaxis protein